MVFIMLKYIKLQNYRSFSDIYIDFTGKNGSPKPLIILYGENGAGKSNIISVIDTLNDIFQSLTMRDFFTRILGSDNTTDKKRAFDRLSKFVNIEEIIKRNKTINSKTNMIIEIGFFLNKKNGCYSIEFDDSEIKAEKLEYTLSQNKGTYFNYSNNSLKLNNSIFKQDYFSDLKNTFMKYKGKYSIISILQNTLQEYSTEYISTHISEQMINILHYFDNMACHLVGSSTNYSIIQDNTNLLDNLLKGEITESESEKMRHTEAVLKQYFTSMYKDIQDVYYTVSNKEKTQQYRLTFKKYICGNLLDIDYSKESTGTRALLNLLPFFLAIESNNVVAIDEIDNGIHDILLANLIKKLPYNEGGQLIITTHNLLLLEEYAFKDYIYFIKILENGNKQIKSLTEYGYRVQPESNVLANYLKDKFGGIPWTEMDIDIKKLRTL